MKQRSLHIQGLQYFGFSAILMVALFSAFQSLIAGPVTGGATGPSTKITVYQGTMAISPGRGTSDTLEIGNPGINGVEITSTGKVYFRPSAKSFDRSVWFDGTSGKADLYVTGKLYINGAAVPPWPSSGGVSYWSQGTGVISPLPQGATPRGLTVTQPITNTDWMNKSALDVVGNSSSSALVVSNLTGPSLSVAGNVIWNGNVAVTSANGTPLTINGLKIWYPGNDGTGSGLDADFIDGRGAYFSFTNSSGQQTTTTATSLDGSSYAICSNSNNICLCNNTHYRGCLILDPSL